MVPLTFAVAPIESQRYQLITFPATWGAFQGRESTRQSYILLGLNFSVVEALVDKHKVSRPVVGGFSYPATHACKVILAQGHSCVGLTPACFSHMPVNTEDGYRYCKDVRTF